MKWLAPILILILLPTVQATCLTTNQIATISDLLDNANFTSGQRETFYEIFDMLCDRSDQTNINDRIDETFELINESETNLNEKITDVNASVNDLDIENATEYYISNYTDWFEDKLEYTKIMRQYGEIINTTLSAQAISDMIKDQVLKETTNMNNDFRENMKSWNDEKEHLENKMVTKDEFTLNISQLRMEIGRRNTSSSNDPIGLYIIAGILIFVVFIGYNMWKQKSRKATIIERDKANPVYKQLVSNGRKRPTQTEVEKLHKIADAIRGEELDNIVENETVAMKADEIQKEERKKQKKSKIKNQESDEPF